MIKNLLKNTDWVILLIVTILFVIGVIGIYSAGYNTELYKFDYIKQIIFFGIMIIPISIVWIVSYRIFDIFGILTYIGSLGLLVLVLFTRPIYGATSWFDLEFMSFQPSELMKIGYILTTAYALVKFKKYNYLIAILLVLPIIGLLALQPDLGTAMSFAVICAIMLFVSGFKYRYIFVALVILSIIVVLAYNFVLNDIQKARIDVFFDPTLDPLGSGYNAIQSKMSVGAGMLFGTGITNGVQTQYGLLPVKTSDFIYSALSEELGFIVSILIIVLFVILIVKILLHARREKDLFAKYILSGIAGMYIFHFIQNIGMTMGLLPITGVPLPFVSYGGSNLITNLIAMSIVLNITGRSKKDFEF